MIDKTSNLLCITRIYADEYPLASKQKRGLLVDVVLHSLLVSNKHNKNMGQFLKRTDLKKGHNSIGCWEFPYIIGCLEKLSNGEPGPRFGFVLVFL